MTKPNIYLVWIVLTSHLLSLSLHNFQTSLEALSDFKTYRTFKNVLTSKVFVVFGNLLLLFIVSVQVKHGYSNYFQIITETQNFRIIVCKRRNSSSQLSHTTINVMAMMEVRLHPCLNLALDGTDLPASHFGHFTFGKEASCIHLIESRLDLRPSGMFRCLSW